jgi:predicted NBD/HSP70 family sugar kinase
LFTFAAATEPSDVLKMGFEKFANAAGAMIKNASAMTSPPSHFVLGDKAFLLSS